MTIKDQINNEYFEWMYDLVGGMRGSKYTSYRKLLLLLHNTEFVYSIPMDENRAEDGVDLRHRFSFLNADILDDPCSVLEMMVALSIRCEESIMDDTTMGDRTGQWFWGMINNLGLSAMTDANFDRRYVEDCVQQFLNRDYEEDGRGGLFRVKNCEVDLRNVEIWYQLCWYLDSIT